MKIETKLTHSGRSSYMQSGSINPPLDRTSTVVFQNLSSFKESYNGVVFESPVYGRSGTSTSFELQKAMADIENTESCITASCGLSAVTAVLGAYSGPGKHILISRGVYGPAKEYCEKELIPLGTKITYYKPDDDLSSLITAETSLIYIETPSSSTMEMFNIEMIWHEADKHNIPVASDSTWGTPVFFKPHELGIDISIHSATKYINGHSDIMLGLITGTYKSLEKVRSWCDRYGSHASPDSCWLALRGLRTLSVRMKKHQENALKVAGWIKNRTEVKELYFPPLSNGKNYELWKKQFSGCAGPFIIELRSCSEKQFENFINSLSLFSLGVSWGGYESLVMPAIPHHLRSMEVMPNEGRLVRFHIGLEDPGDLCRDIENAFSYLN